MMLIAVFAAVSVQLERSCDATQIPVTKKQRPNSIHRPVIIQFHGPIDYKLSKYFHSRLAQAKKSKADLVIIEIDSPGGLKTESLAIAEKLRDIDWAYTVAFVPDEAISGGALVAFGCDEIVIAPEAKFGDIGEIYLDPLAQAYRLVPAKEQSFLITSATNLATSKGRPPELAEALIDKNVLVYWKSDATGKKIYQTARVDDKDKPVPPWKLIKETGPERFLTVSGARAKEIGIAETIGSTREDVAKELHFDLTEVQVFRATWTDSVVYYLNTPFVTGVLVLIGLIALYVEFSAPGVGIGGLMAGLCAALFFWSRFLGGTSTWLEVLLFLAGIIFLAVELFVIPGWGFAGIIGIGLLFVSVVMASQDFVVPSTTRQWNQLVTTLLMILCTGLAFVAAAAVLARRLGSLPVFNQMILAPALDGAPVTEIKGEYGKKPVPQEHPLVSIGDWGRAESLLRPAGRAVFNGLSVDVVSDGSYVDAGTQVRVVKIQGNMITVAPIDEEDDELGQTTYPGS